MCGRFTLSSGAEDLMGQFPMNLETLVYRPRYNVAPTQQVLTYGASGPRSGQFMRWGLIPFFHKQGEKPPYNTFNARDDKLSGGMWRNSFKRKRCLILADGFYEWKKEGKDKTPMRITLTNGEPFGMAGLWDEWTDTQTGETVHSCTIITTSPNELMAPIHDRMPVILPPECHADWLNRENLDTDSLKRLIAPFPAERMTACQVSPLVNSVKNESPECIAPVS